MNYKIPKEVKNVLKVLNEAGFDAYIVGGCVRDLMLNKVPADWDITTSAKPDEIVKLFPESVYENNFGTVGIKTDRKDKSLKIIEVTPFRKESNYSDKRHPDNVTYSETLNDDLKRRDFTVNALAIRLEDKKDEVVDLFDGKKDLERKILRTVGEPKERFNEDALRLMRAVRLSSQLDFIIEKSTNDAIKKYSSRLKLIAKERIRDEFSKLILSDSPDKGIEKLRETGMLKHVAPEVEEGYKVGQNKHHIYSVWEHNLRALKHASENNWSLEVRMAALLHDVAKPKTKRGNGANSTFYGHDVVGARMTAKLLSRLRYSKEFTEKVAKLVRYHLFYYNVDEVTDSSVRRLVRKVGPEHMDDLIKVRICDRIGSGVPKAEPYKLRHFKFMVEKLARDPISVKMLKVNGEDVIKEGKLCPGKKVGFILNILLDEVLDDPAYNKRTHLLGEIKKLVKMSENELNKLADKSKRKSSGLEEEEIGKIKGKHHVK